MNHVRWRGEISKVDDERRIVGGWAYVAKRRDGSQVVDHSGEFIDELAEMEDVVHDYVLHSREGDTMHQGPVTARLVETFFATPDKLAKMGAPPDALPVGWWVAFKVDSDETWGRVKDGSLAMFSIHGSAAKEAVAKVDDSLTGRIDAVRRALERRAMDMWPQRVAEDHVIAEGDGGRLWRIAYTVDDGGVVTLGDAIEVEVDYKPVGKAPREPAHA